MSRDDTTVGEHGCGADVAAYALGALDPAEAVAFERHLTSCVVCPDELTSFKQVVDRLAMSAPSNRASCRLRRRLLADASPQTVAPPTRLRRPRPAGRPWPRAAVALSGALVLAAATLAGLGLLWPGSTTARVITARVSGQGTAQLSVNGDHAQLIVHRFSPPPAGEIYEVWLEYRHRPPEPTSALFSVTAAGEADVAVPNSIRRASQVMVTPEPAGGTRVPTHTPVIRADLT